MALPFDVRALLGRTLGSVLDEIAPWSGSLGFTEDGPVSADEPIFFVGGTPPSADERQRGEAESQKRAQIKSRLAPLIAALHDRTAVLVDIDGTAVPAWVWYSGRWTFYRDDERGVEWLEAVTEAGAKVEYYNPTFTEPAVKRTDEGPARSGKPVAGGAPSPIVWRGVELYRTGLNYVRAAAALFDERHPKPRDERDRTLWLDQRRRFIGDMRTKIRKAHKGSRSD